jgi:hypothetical protein
MATAQGVASQGQLRTLLAFSHTLHLDERASWRWGDGAGIVLGRIIEGDIASEAQAATFWHAAQSTF